MKAMKITKILLAAIGMALPAALPAQTSEAPEITASEEQGQDIANEFKQMEYNGFLFDIPTDSHVAIDRNLKLNHPDGTFGLSMTILESPGTDQKRAENLCRGLANELKIQNASVSKIKINGMKGALAKGTVDQHQVAVLLLPYQGREMTAIILADKDRQGWTDRYLRTIRKK